MSRPLSVCLILLLFTCRSAYAQDPPPGSTPASADPQIELNLVNLPTTRSIGRHKSYTRFTHRFSRDLRLGDFGDLAADLFSLDNGSVLGFEYRYGITSSLHAGIHRNTLDKTLQVFGRWDALRQGGRMPVGVSGFASIEGLDNLQEAHQPGVGAVLSFTRGQAIALYASPTFVDGTLEAGLRGGGAHDHDHFPAADTASVRDDAGEHAGHDGTFFVGLGTRVRLLPTVFVTGEISPRLAGHDPGDPGWGLSLEKWTRGHTLALTLTNSYGTTPGQIARGGTNALYLGFNLTRKF